MGACNKSPNSPLPFRLQNSPYFCVLKYARAVKQKVWGEAENSERDWGETLKIQFFFLASPHTAYGRVRLARVRLLRHTLPFFTDFEKKTRLSELKSLASSHAKPVCRKSRKLLGLGKLFHVYRVCIQDQSFNNFENDKMKLSFNEAKLTGF